MCLRYYYYYSRSAFYSQASNLPQQWYTDAVQGESELLVVPVILYERNGVLFFSISQG